jgi:hypothetical protein
MDAFHVSPFEQDQFSVCLITAASHAVMQVVLISL